MKILLVAPMVAQADGPGAMPMLLQAQLAALTRRHDVTLVAGVGDEPWEASAARDLVDSGADVHLADRRQPMPMRQRIRRRLRLGSEWACTRRPWVAAWFATPAVQALLDELAITRNFDLVAVEDSSMGTLRLPPAVPAVLTEHEVGRPRPTVWRPNGRTTFPEWTFRELDWRRWATFQPAVWRRYDRVQVFTPLDARTVAILAPDVSPRVRINPFGMIMPAPVDHRREEPGTILFVGNFSHVPNRDAAVWLVRAIMPRVRVARPEARLRLVGSAPPREVLALAGAGVDVIADVPDVRLHLEAACVCVAPVRIGGGMRVKILNALASGKPVVTTSRGAEGYSQAARDPPLVVSDDVEGIAAGIAQLLADDSRRRELGRSARAFAEEFYSARAWGTRLEAVYEEARENRRS